MFSYSVENCSILARGIYLINKYKILVFQIRPIIKRLVTNPLTFSVMLRNCLCCGLNSSGGIWIAILYCKHRRVNYHCRFTKRLTHDSMLAVEEVEVNGC